MTVADTETARDAGSGPIMDEAADLLRDLHGNALDALVVERVVVGVFFVGIKLSNGNGGIAYNPPELIGSAGNRILKERSPAIRGMAVSRVMDGGIPNPFSDIIRLAALNALSRRFFEQGQYRIDESEDVSGVPALFSNRRVCMVGAIIPLLKRLKALNTSEVVIIDRKKETQEEAESGYGVFIRPEHTAEALARCDTAVFTGATVANGTLQGLIDMVPPKAAIAVVGPTAGFVPEPLFRRNVAMVGTAAVIDSDAALDILSEGGGGYRLFGNCVRKINLLNTERLKRLGL